MRRNLALGAAGSCFLGLGSLFVHWVDVDLDTPRDLHDHRYARSGECESCHPDHTESWARTFHSRMTQTASPDAVLGDFEDVTVRYGGVDAHMSRTDEGGYRMVFDGPAGVFASADVVLTVGSRRVQQYLAQEGDTYFRLPVAWDVERQRWFHMNGAFLTPDPEPGPDGVVPRADYERHVTRWNDNCVFCHNVAPNPGRAAGSDTFNTTVAELGIACEACHGPGDEHVRLNRNPLRRYALHLSERPDPTIVNPARLSPERSAEVCGRCHGQRITDDLGRFMREGDPFVAGDRLDQYSRPLARDTPLAGASDAFAARFWPDGTARLTAYEYQGLLQSPCQDLTCTDCHGMHEGDPRGQLRPEAVDDGACTSCHETVEDTPSHLEHSTVSCVDCHMPRIVYGLIGVHRSHRIEIPDPEVVERPNACALCHVEGTAEPSVRLEGSPSHTPPPGTSGFPLGQTLSEAIGGDPIERAVAVAALGRADGQPDPRQVALRRGVLLDVMQEDPYPAVRQIAHRSLQQLGPTRDPGAYEATAEPAARRAVSSGLRAELSVAELPAPEVQQLRREAVNRAIEIGE